MMKRKVYDEMMKWKANHKTALLLRGPLQTGKTYLMKLFSKEYSSSLYVNKGAIMENATAQSLVSSGFGLHFYAKEDSKLELDFVIKYKGKVTGLEVKSGRSKNSKSLLLSLKDGTVDAGIKIADFKVEKDVNGVQHLPLFSPAFMESMTWIDLDLPDVSDLNRMVEANR
jgi:hypothetical protein